MADRDRSRDDDGLDEERIKGVGDEADDDEFEDSDDLEDSEADEDDQEGTF
ncbi:MAG TPA: hypothetical protein VL484_19215 [Vicinamibacterales bacterium]|jgi:hypothetical protein|nr:hypothetical protein [Vicinamibacterales bacterium]